MLQQYSGLGIYLIAAIIFPFIIVFVADSGTKTSEPG